MTGGRSRLARFLLGWALVCCLSSLAVEAAAARPERSSKSRLGFELPDKKELETGVEHGLSLARAALDEILQSPLARQASEATKLALARTGELLTRTGHRALEILETPDEALPLARTALQHALEAVSEGAQRATSILEKRGKGSEEDPLATGLKNLLQKVRDHARTAADALRKKRKD